MKAVKTKAQERKELENQIRFYLQHGGKVELVDSGVSGRPIGSAFQHSSIAFNQPRESRTLLLDQVKAIDSRKKPAAPISKSKKVSKPRKVLVTDDFGEPIKWIWKDD